MATKSPRGVWVLQCREFPGAISQTRRLSAAADLMREAIAFVADVPESDVEIHVVPTLPEKILDDVAALRDAVRQLDQTQREVGTLSRRTASELKAEGLTGTDIATVMEISPQRVSQLLNG